VRLRVLNESGLCGYRCLKIGVRNAFGGPYLRIGAVKAYADGSLGSGTAYFYEPFLNQGNSRGLLSDEMHPIALMRDRYMKADAAGIQICTHAIGDAELLQRGELTARIYAALSRWT
jgi:predicted amidohydrolase YtcJ